MLNTHAAAPYTGSGTAGGEACERQMQRGFRWLRFEPELEELYRQQVITQARRPVLVIVVAALTIWSVFAVFDFVRLDLYGRWPPAADIWVLLGARWVVLGLLVCCLLPQMRAHDLLEWKALGVYLLLCLGVALTSAIYKANGIAAAETAQIVVVMAAFLPLGMRFYQALAGSLAMVGFTALAGLAILPQSLWQGQAALLAVMAMAVPVGAVGSYLREHADRRQFLLGAILQHQAQFDPLTDLANRRLFQRHASAALAHAGRTGDGLVLAVVDIDHFKAFNDRFGHTAGDEALRLVAEVIGDAARRPMDMAARLGGEEFALLLYGTDLDQAGPILETMRRRIGDIVLAADGSVTISIGATTCNDGEDLEGLYARADALLYASKREGRDKLTLG
ncbi:sensor domain-containing diguanylate cyclase [Devosia salina]|uniref:diguanylate cyclase n=1 Tax=Devosia salina TaxID=2860336 RepID=A0ABX8WC42_9HYPH|nr:GGDEF domain-containing protein [Devosia salina]QYO76484.1 GGDEF domain-containing protein [Devosia salina]